MNTLLVVTERPFPARIGKAIASPKRHELIELLAQGEKTVETLAEQARIDVHLASAHLRALREARLVETRRAGKFIHYRLSGPDVARLWMNVREVAEEHLVELRVALDQMVASPDALSSESRESLLAKARSGDIVVVDVRPEAEYVACRLLQHSQPHPFKKIFWFGYADGPASAITNSRVWVLRDQSRWPASSWYL